MARPREVANPAGSVLGAIAGGLLGGPPGIILGGLVGTAANPTVPVPLDRALARQFEIRGLRFESVLRTAKNGVRVMFSRPDGSYWFIFSTVTPDMAWTPDQLEDALYDAVLAKLQEVHPLP